MQAQAISNQCPGSRTFSFELDSLPQEADFCSSLPISLAVQSDRMKSRLLLSTVCEGVKRPRYPVLTAITDIRIVDSNALAGGMKAIPLSHIAKLFALTHVPRHSSLGDFGRKCSVHCPSTQCREHCPPSVLSQP